MHKKARSAISATLTSDHYEHAVGQFRFPLSLPFVEELLLQRVIVVCYGTMGCWP